MKNIRFGFLPRAMLFLGFAFTSLSHAAPPPAEESRQIPEALKPWVNWALWDEAVRLCPTRFSDPNSHLCFWPSRMGLQATQTGAEFDVAITVFSESWIPLPGGSGAWPEAVRVDGTPVVVVEHDTRPAVHLAPGTFHLTGEYHWGNMPQRLAMPREIGILALVVDGQPVETPSWDGDGSLWLKRSASTEEVDHDSLSMKVYAQIEDGLPLWLHTEVELIVSGKSREEDLGIVLPEGWKIASVGGPIPAAVDETGKMKAQVRAGRWTLHVDAFRLDQPKEFRFAPGAKPAASDELIGFRAKPEFRTVEVSGMPSVDVSQTTFPEAWREGPVYRWDTSKAFTIEERMRGMGQKKLEGLRIKRELWLDENGRDLTFRDEINGLRQQIWRLDAADGLELGSVRSGGQGQLITRNPQSGAPGVEIRQRDLNLEATGRLPRAASLSATGWRTDADSLQLTLNLPPGWRLFALFGADWVRGDWLTTWTLLDLFLLLVFTLAVYRLWSWRAAVLAFVAFGLSYQEPGAPRYLWIILLVPLALQRVVPEGWGRRIVEIGKWIAIAVFVFVFVPFIVAQITQALYPQLESASGYRGNGYRTVVETPDFTAQSGMMAPAPAEADVSKMRQKLERIVIPKLEFRENTIQEAIDYLAQQSVELDAESPANDRGVRLVLHLESSVPGTPPAPGIPGMQSPADARITVSLTNIPLIEALKYVTGLANLKYKIQPDQVVIVPLTENTDVLITKEWKIPPDLIPRTPGAAGAADVTRGGTGVADRESAKNWLIANGLAFNGNASATYIPGRSVLIVRNTQDQLDLIDTITSSGGSRSAVAGSADATISSSRGWVPSENLNYDPKARIQTGPGVPEWKWREVSFGWNGPVSASQQVRPMLISLGLERLLTVLRIALLLVLAAVLLGARKISSNLFRAPGKVAALLIFALLSAHASAQSNIPDSSTIELLRKRLLEVSNAYPRAAEIPSASLTLNERKIVLDAEVHAAIRTAVPMPGRLPAWSPVTVLVDDKPEVSLRRDDGFLWVLFEAGIHHVHIEGSLAATTEWEWNYVLKPRRVKIDAPEWNVSGVKPDGTADSQVILSRKQKVVAEQSSYEQQALETIVIVDRRIELGLVWQIHTTVRRLSPPGKAAVLHIPLVTGENVLTSGAIVKDGAIEVRLNARAQTYSWESEIVVSKQIKLATRANDTWVEQWRLIASPVWDVTLSGLTPVFEQSEALIAPVWHPWPGEGIELTVNRPEAMAGATMTVDRAAYELALGKRQRTSQLNFSLRSSLGQDFLVELPADAEVTSLTRDGASIPVRKDAGKLVIAVHPGEQNLAVGWKRDVSLGLRAASDEVRLPVESANIQSKITVPDNRWVLWASGPQRGPAVRFWGILLCSLLAALALGRMARSPLSGAEWMLLVIGLTQVPLAAALAVVLWLFFVAWRGSDAFQSLGKFGYNTLQIVLIPLTIGALCILVGAVSEGLLGRPEMFIEGNGSSHSVLQWFKPRSEGQLPQCACVSISIWWYRFLMLLWALWLAMALIRWLQQGWKNYGAGGYFRRAPKTQPVARVARPAAAAVPPPMPPPPSTE